MLKKIELAKIGLFANGVNISSSARDVLGLRGTRPLTLAEYASTSGVSLELEENIWVNAPIKDFNPNFVGNSPYTLDFKNDFFLISPLGEIKVRPIPVPNFHDKINARGQRWTDFAVTHTDRVRISPIAGCVNSCQFCDMPQMTYRKKDVGDLVESVHVALDDLVLPARHILISGGTPRLEDFVYEREIYRRVAEEFDGREVDVMMSPIFGLIDLNELKRQGVSAVYFNLEVYNETLARKLMKGKSHIGREDYFKYLEKAREVFGEGNSRSLLMVGLESMDETLNGVEAIAQRGVDPILSPFRPSPKTPLSDVRPPIEEFMIELYERARDVVIKYTGAKLGPRCIPCMHNTLTFPEDIK